MKKVESDATIALGNSNCIIGILQEGVNYPEQRVLCNYNCGSMGDDITQAIGVAAAGSKPVYCVTGDGSIMMNLQELQTITYHQFPIKIVLFNNEGYGAIRATCSNFFAGTYTGCDVNSGISFPDFSKVAAAFEIPFYRSHCVGELEDGIEWLIEEQGPCILEIYEMIDEIKGPRIESKMNENGEFTTPPLYDMSPFLSKEELERYILK